MIAEGAVTASRIIENFPEGKEVQIHTTADLTLAFWMPLTGNWGAEIDIPAPGQFVGVGGSIGRLTGTANIRIF